MCVRALTGCVCGYFEYMVCASVLVARCAPYSSFSFSSSAFSSSSSFFPRYSLLPLVLLPDYLTLFRRAGQCKSPRAVPPVLWSGSSSCAP
eukprot:9494225-Pyramimonas_sp.AAC.1